MSLGVQHRYATLSNPSFSCRGFDRIADQAKSTNEKVF
jgi:hypothetical protein